jgi:electron transfer flavoprotein alpha subunit
MADSILVVVEQREGKLNRVSWETVRAAQMIAAETKWEIEAAVVGSGIGGVASEIASAAVKKVYAVENQALAAYTPDGFVQALRGFIEGKKPKLVLMPHTYQVRDFVPQLATSMGRTMVSDCIGFRNEGGKLVFTRQMFQGKFAADVAIESDAPWFVTFQAGAFRGDQAEKGGAAAPVETVQASVDAATIRT